VLRGAVDSYPGSGAIGAPVRASAHNRNLLGSGALTAPENLSEWPERESNPRHADFQGVKCRFMQHRGVPLVLV
jgi:hypothetical protein